MKMLRYYLFVFTIISALLAALPSCKEKNDDYPPRPWSEFSYTGNGIELRDISAILYENDHSIWLGSKGTEGLLFNDGYTWITFNKNNTGIHFDSITAITRDGNNILWVGFRSGLASYDGNIWKNMEVFDGLRVTSIVVEGIGKIRAGIKGKSGGIATYQNSYWTFESPDNSGIPSGNINALVSDNDQVLWAATADKGIIKLKNSRWEIVSSNISLLSQDFSSISKALDGTTWAASAASQLLHFYNDTYTILNTGTSKPITSVVASADSSIWSGTLGAGLIEYSGTKWLSFTTGNDAAMPSDEIYSLSQGFPGYLFFSVPGGRIYLIKN